MVVFERRRRKEVGYGLLLGFPALFPFSCFSVYSCISLRSRIPHLPHKRIDQSFYIVQASKIFVFELLALGEISVTD